MSTHITPFDALPDSAFLRESQLVLSPKRPGALAPLVLYLPTLHDAAQFLVRIGGRL